MYWFLVALAFLNVLFNAAVWPQFYRRVQADPRARDAHGRPTKFLRVHRVLFIATGVVTFVTAIGAIAGVFAR
ncbi:SCO4848 family membrane protein [Rarobacter faecitabidus]|nr:hypothetical protein [Rarobacter faecitabidus]